MSFFVSLGRARISFRFLSNAILIAILPIKSNINFFVHVAITSTMAPNLRSGRCNNIATRLYTTTTTITTTATTTATPP